MYVQRATWAGQITQSEQVYSALESGVVMFRLFVLCTKISFRDSSSGTMSFSRKQFFERVSIFTIKYTQPLELLSKIF